MDDTTLYDYWRSSASYRCRIALHLAQIPFTAVQIDLTAAAQTTPDHLSRNPQGRVPVLDIDGERLTQSLAIIDYLNETRGLGLLSKDPMRRAKERAAAQALAVDIHPVCNLQVARHATLLSGTEDTMGAWMHHFIRPGMVAFEALLESLPKTTFACGDTLGLADLCLVPQAYNADRWGIDISDLPRTSAALAACTAHPAVQAAHPDRYKP